MSFPTNDNLRAALVRAGYPNHQLNDGLLQLLKDAYNLANTALNDALYRGLAAFPYAGSLADKIAAWDGTTTFLEALGILSRFGTDAHAYIPGIGQINGLTAGNFLDSARTTPATVDGLVGGVTSPLSTIHATQATTANKPILRKGAVNSLIQSGFNSSTVGPATVPASWSNTGTGNTGCQILTEEVVDGNVCKPFRLYVPGATGIHGIQQSNTIVVGVPYTLSAYIRVPTGAVVDGSGCWCYLGGGTPGGLTLATAATLNAQPKDVWVRYSATITFTVLPVFIGWSIGMNSATVNCTFDMACIQAELGSTATPYIPTTTASASNNIGPSFWQFDGVDDRLELGSVPFQMSDDHAVIACANSLGDGASGDRTIFSIRSTSSSNPLIGVLDVSNGVPRAIWRDDASTLGLLGGGSSVTGVTSVLSLRKSGNNKILRVGGTQVGATNTTVMGATTINSVAIGCSALATPAAFFLGNIHCVIAIKGTVSDADLLTLEKFAGLFGGVTI